jgi:alkaline phosphatase D
MFPERVREKYFAQFRVPEFGSHISNCPTYATWDDHDCVCDDCAGVEYANGKREQSLNVFKQMFANPAFGELGLGNDGTYFSFAWGDADFFVLDVRYYRQKTAPATILGSRQERWLLDGLRNSTAKFKFIVSGTPWHVENVPHVANFDSWQNYPDSANELSAVLESISDNVIFLSGDFHQCALVDRETTGPKRESFSEFISSGIGARSADPTAPLDQCVGNFVTIHVDTTGGNATLRAEIINESGAWEQRKTLTVTSAGTVVVDEVPPQ